MGTCTPGTPGPLGKREVYNKTLCLSSWESAVFQGTHRACPQASQSIAHVPIQRELHRSPDQRLRSGRRRAGVRKLWLLCEGATRTRDNSAGTPPTCKPGTGQQQFPKPFSEDRPRQVSRATGRGRSFSKGPASLSLQPMRNRRFPAHCCLLLTPQRSASGLAAFEQGAFSVPSPEPPFGSIHKIPDLSGSRGRGRGGTGKKTNKGPSSQNHKSFYPSLSSLHSLGNK